MKRLPRSNVKLRRLLANILSVPTTAWTYQEATRPDCCHTRLTSIRRKDLNVYLAFQDMQQLIASRMDFPRRWAALCRPEYTCAAVIEFAETSKLHFLRFQPP